MALSDLLDGYAECEALTVSGIQSHSAQVGPGDLFAACRGRSHGLSHLDEARQRGAIAAIYDPEQAPELSACDIPLIAVPALSRVLSEIAGRFFHNPSTHLSLLGVTGTDGKTSTTHLIAQLLQTLGQACGMIGTLGAGVIDRLRDTGLTTPGAVQIQAELFRMVQHSTPWAVLEVSSHALDQHRCDGLQFDTAVFTTLGRDHLDYHGTPERYAAAKRRLFTELHPRRAVINLDDSFGAALVTQLSADIDVHTCGLTLEADSTAKNLHTGLDGLAFEWHVGGRSYPVEVPGLYGRFNVMNLLLSATAVHATGIEAQAVAQAMAACQPVPGRLQCVARTPCPILIDYAHTPGALQAALTALNDHFQAPVHVVFGCGGMRDAGKRPLMGEVAARLAHKITLTNDNPRQEDPVRIVQDIQAGLKGANTTVEYDRARAIAQAIDQATAEEVILIAGKGHESTQHTADGMHPFSDHQQVQASLGAPA